MRDIKKMTASTEKEILNEYGVPAEADSSAVENVELCIPRVTGGVDSDHVGDDDSIMYANDAVASSICTSTRVRRVLAITPADLLTPLLDDGGMHIFMTSRVDQVYVLITVAQVGLIQVRKLRLVYTSTRKLLI